MSRCERDRCGSSARFLGEVGHGTEESPRGRRQELVESTMVVIVFVVLLSACSCGVSDMCWSTVCADADLARPDGCGCDDEKQWFVLAYAFWARSRRSRTASSGESSMEEMKE